MKAIGDDYEARKVLGFEDFSLNYIVERYSALHLLVIRLNIHTGVTTPQVYRPKSIVLAPTYTFKSISISKPSSLALLSSS